MADRSPLAVWKGRGAVSNPPCRYHRERREPEPDGWWQDDPPGPPVTSVAQTRAGRIISRNTSPDVPFDRSINPYQGCEHGCVYCFARPTHAYLGLSPGLDFETRIFAKPEAARLLAAELRRPGYRVAPIAMGTNTDPYQPTEKRLGLTRAILEVLAEFRHPVTITTKSALVVRDLDILAPMAARGLVRVAISVTTLDPALSRVMEPRATTPGRRLAAIGGLADAGVPVAVMAAPMIPFVNDHEMEGILAAAAEAGASAAGWVLLRLPLELKELFERWLETHFPDRASRVLARLRDCRGGALYDAAWGMRMKGTGPYADLLARRFARTCERLGLAGPGAAGGPLDCSLFRPPGAQLDLFTPSPADQDEGTRPPRHG